VYLPTRVSREVDVGERDQLQEAADETVIADLLGNASLRVARNEVGYDADAAVVEATEQAVLKLVLRHRALCVVSYV